MASSFKFVALLLVLSSVSALAVDWTPFNENICDEVKCGKGNCVANSTYPFNFVCQCDAGWKRTRFDSEDDVMYLPCIIPNCSLEYSCMPAPAPMPSTPHNLSFFDPCYWTYCGGGTCTKTDTYEHVCKCDSGYSNLNNVTVFPCFNECAIRSSDCVAMGIKLSSENSTSTPGSGGDSHAFSTLPGRSAWMALFATSMALFVWN